MTGARGALLIGTSEHIDTRFSRLRAPMQDTAALAEVLGDKRIGQFEVSELLNRPTHEVTIEVERFFKNRNRDDVLLLYITGHGMRDQDGVLHFVCSTTRKDYLASTALSATFLLIRLGKRAQGPL